MYKPLRKCAHPGCNRLTADGYCPEHKPASGWRTGGATKPSAKWHYLYTDPRYGWVQRRTRHLLAEPFCRECAKQGIRTYATDVDHVIPHKGNPELFLHGELQSLCHACHARKTIQENPEVFKPWQRRNH